MGVALTLAAVAAGTSIYSAHKQASAAKDAAKTQSDAADKAIGLQQERYQQSRQDFSPYQQAGAASLNRLQQRAGAPPPQFTPGQPTNFGALGAPQMPQAGAGGRVQPMTGALGASAGRMVTIQAPDGSTRQLPEQAAQGVIQNAAAQGHQLRVVG